MTTKLQHVLLCVVVLISSTQTYAAGLPAEGDFVQTLPKPGTMVALSPAYVPPVIKGLTIHQDNPFLFDFIVDVGQNQLNGDQLKAEGEKLIKYFLAAMTIPEKDLWVNLSPYEKNRIIPEALGQTEMGRDMLAQDYILKQIAASLVDPGQHIGQEFWSKIYNKTQPEVAAAVRVPVNTFNKIWIVPSRADIFERGQTVFIVDSHLKVMLEEDYTATFHRTNAVGRDSANPTAANQVIQNLILPEIEKEVNTGKNFALLRQIVHSLILANWYKSNLKQAILTQVYADKSAVRGIDEANQQDNQKIYERYVEAYKKGVFNFIKEDPAQGMPKKYFSGGVSLELSGAVHKVPGITDSQAMASLNTVRIKAGVQVNQPNASRGSKKQPQTALEKAESVLASKDSQLVVGVMEAFAYRFKTLPLVVISGNSIPGMPKDKIIFGFDIVPDTLRAADVLRAFLDVLKIQFNLEDMPGNEAILISKERVYQNFSEFDQERRDRSNSRKRNLPSAEISPRQQAIADLLRIYQFILERGLAVNASHKKFSSRLEELKSGRYQKQVGERDEEESSAMVGRQGVAGLVLLGTLSQLPTIMQPVHAGQAQAKSQMTASFAFPTLAVSPNAFVQALANMPESQKFAFIQQAIDLQMAASQPLPPSAFEHLEAMLSGAFIRDPQTGKTMVAPTQPNRLDAAYIILTLAQYSLYPQRSPVIDQARDLLNQKAPLWRLTLEMEAKLKLNDLVDELLLTRDDVRRNQIVSILSRVTLSDDILDRLVQAVAETRVPISKGGQSIEIDTTQGSARAADAVLRSRMPQQAQAIQEAADFHANILRIKGTPLPTALLPLLSPNAPSREPVSTLRPQSTASLPGGIDLDSASTETNIQREGAGVSFKLDPVTLERVRQDGVHTLFPVIYNITPVNVRPLLGLDSPLTDHNGTLAFSSN